MESLLSSSLMQYRLLVTLPHCFEHHLDISRRPNDFPLFKRSEDIYILPLNRWQSPNTQFITSWLIKSTEAVQSINLVVTRSCTGTCISFTSRVQVLLATCWAGTWTLIFHWFFSLSGCRTRIALGGKDYSVSKWHLASKSGLSCV